jgi:hypothetical protein
MPPITVEDALSACLQALERHGLLLQQDQRLPSLVGIIVGGPLRGSWWGHPDGSLVYRTMQALEDHPDLLETKLLAGKVTYVHRRLWPALVAAGLSRSGWQLDDLSETARWLLACLDHNGEVQLNELPLPAGLSRKALPDAAREFERRLLARGYSVHTPGGAHAKCLEAWPRWLARDAPGLPLPSVAEAQAALEGATVGLAAGAVGLLPWHQRRGTR